MKKKILNIVLAAAVTPFLCCCTDNFEEYNTNPYEPHSLNPPMLFATMITTGINVQQNDNQMIDQMVAEPSVVILRWPTHGVGPTSILLIRRNPGIRFLSTHPLKNSIPITSSWRLRQVEKATIGRWQNSFV